MDNLDRTFGVFRYKDFPKRTPRDVLLYKYNAQKYAIAQAIHLNKKFNSRFYWRPLEESELL